MKKRYIIPIIIVIIGSTIFYAYQFNVELGETKTSLQSWSWFFSTVIKVCLSIFVSVLLYVMSSKLPKDILTKTMAYSDKLREPLYGYDTVTKAIIEVINKTTHTYHSATLTPTIGLIKSLELHQEYTSKLLHLIQSRTNIKMLCLDDLGMKGYFENIKASYSTWNDSDRLWEITKQFIDYQLLPSSLDDDYYRHFSLAGVSSLPFQLCISDNERAVIYFTSPSSLKAGHQIVGFYTEDRAIVSILETAFSNLHTTIIGEKHKVADNVNTTPINDINEATQEAVQE